MSSFLRRFCQIFAIAATSASAADINWNSTIGSNNYTSEGAPHLMGEGFTFELGSFSDGFVPSAANVSEWAGKWVSLDRDVYNPVTKFFASKASLTSNDQPFTPAVRPYIWGFDQGAPGEWLLVTNPGWFWPFAGGGPQPPLTWSVGASGTVAIVGEVNGAGFQMKTAEVAVEPPDVNPAAWRQRYFNATERNDPAISGWVADPDSDGANNLIELAAGTDPRDPAARPQPEIELVEVGGGARALQVRLPRNHRAAISYGAESSSDLDAWSATGMTVEVDTLTEIVFIFPATAARQFLRLAFSL